MSNIEKMTRELAEKQRKQRAALRGLEELELMSHSLQTCVQDCNGEPGNGFAPDLEEAARLIRLMYWKTARVRALLEGRDTDGCDIEIALCDLCSNRAGDARLTGNDRRQGEDKAKGCDPRGRVKC